MIDVMAWPVIKYFSSKITCKMQSDVFFKISKEYLPVHPRAFVNTNLRSVNLFNLASLA